jgi:deoxyribonuclease-4
LRLGIHTSIAGSLERAALKAAELGANTFQIFSASPRMWRAALPDPADVRRLRAARERYDLRPLAIHAGYLINLASSEPLVRAKSIQAFHGELERAALIGAEYLVLHPGSAGERSAEEASASFAVGLRDAAKGFRSRRVTVLLESTAGCGTSLGSRFEELQSIRELALDLTSLPVGFCLDTCHLLAAGFDIAARAGLDETLQQAAKLLGWSHIRLIHANDSKTPRGSRVDRHANIGEGHIGKAGFRRILAHPKLHSLPFILETPFTNPGDDRFNLDTLKALSAKPRTKASRVLLSR